MRTCIAILCSVFLTLATSRACAQQNQLQSGDGWSIVATGPAEQIPDDGHPDAWLYSDLPPHIKSQIAAQLGPGFVVQMNGSRWIRVRTDRAPATPLADMSTAGTIAGDSRYGFPDGIVDADDWNYFSDLFFGRSELLEVAQCTDPRNGTPMLSLDLFQESFSVNFGRQISLESAFENLTAVAHRPFGSILGWKCRLALYAAMQEVALASPSDSCTATTARFEFRAAITRKDALDADFSDLGCAGLWRRSDRPMYIADDFWFEVDNRLLCEPGTSRLEVSWNVASNEIGVNSGVDPLVLKARWVAICSPSGYFDHRTGTCEFRTAKADLYSVVVRHIDGCRTLATCIAQGQFPFGPLLTIQIPNQTPVIGGAEVVGSAPLVPYIATIDWQPKIIVGVASAATPGCGKISARVSGFHSRFPDFDVRASLSGGPSECIYQFSSADTLPSILGLDPDPFPLGPFTPGLIAPGAVEFFTPFIQSNLDRKIAPGC